MEPLTKVPDLKFEPDWRRLKFVIEQSCMSEEQFAEFIRLEDPGIFVHIRYGQCGIDVSLAQRIFRAFPQFTTDWLLGRTDAPLPATADMFPQVQLVKTLSFRAFEQAEKEFKETAMIISGILIQMIPLRDLERAKLFEKLHGNIVHLMLLFETMRQNTQPATRDRMQEASCLCDDLCQAAEEYGLPL